MGVRVLLLAANPLDTERLRLDNEMRTIDQRLRQGDVGREVELTPYLAVRVADVSEALIRTRPHIVHFLGHGTSPGVTLEDEAGKAFVVPKAALGDLFGILRDEIQCVVFNACYTEDQAQAVREHVGAVVGTTDSITDDGAVAFAAGFYLGVSYGRTVRECFQLGRNQVGLVRLPDEGLFHLLEGPGNALDQPIRENATEDTASHVAGSDKADDSRSVGSPSTSTIIFDISHRQNEWTGIPAPVPTAGFRRFTAIASEGRSVTTVDQKPLTDERLAGAKCLVLSVAPVNGTRLQGAELDALRSFVDRGGGVLVLGAYSADQHHGANLDAFLTSYGMTHGDDVLGPPELSDPGAFQKRAKFATTWGPSDADVVVTAGVAEGSDNEPANRSAVRSALSREMGRVASVSPCSIVIDPHRAVAIATARFRVAIPEYRVPGFPAIERYQDNGVLERTLVGASVYGKVIAVGSWKTFIDDFLYDESYGNAQLLRNILDWLCAGTSSSQ